MAPGAFLVSKTFMWIVSFFVFDDSTLIQTPEKSKGRMRKFWKSAKLFQRRMLVFIWT
jgi:hypothetical protein